MRVDKFDAEVIEAAWSAAPIFAANDWKYANDDGMAVPTPKRLMHALQGLVDDARSEFDPDKGEMTWSTGRWSVRRTFSEYTFDPTEHEITISLELGTIEWTEADS